MRLEVKIFGQLRPQYPLAADGVLRLELSDTATAGELLHALELSGEGVFVLVDGQVRPSEFPLNRTSTIEIYPYLSGG